MSTGAQSLHSHLFADGYLFRWDLVWSSRDVFLQGLYVSLRIAGAVMATGSVLGLAIALCRVSKIRILSVTATAYVELVRNTPLLLLIFFVYFGFGIQGLHPLGSLSSVLVAMTLNSGAYLSEVFRAGILSVSKNYVEAGQAVGLSQSRILWHVTLPLMFAQALPALTNSAVGIFKDSSLASALSVPELTFASENFAVFTFRTFEAFTASGVLYLAASLLFGVGLRRLEPRALRWM